MQIIWVMVPMGQKVHQVLGLNRAITTRPMMVEVMDSLMKWNPEETTKCCCDCLNREMNFASDRNTYRNIFHRMALLKTYPGGQAAIDSLLTLWQETYPRRSAMLDEMKKAEKEKGI